jgi:RNA polymerase-associated protein
VAPILWRLPHWGIDLSGESEAIQNYARRIFARPAFELSLSAAERDMGA